MKTASRRRVASAAHLVLLVVGLSGCGLALPPTQIPSQRSLRLVSKVPEQFTVQVRLHDHDNSALAVPHEGRITLGIPAFRRPCYPIVMGIPFRYGQAPVSIRVQKASQIVRELSLDQFDRLPVDREGYRILKIKGD